MAEERINLEELEPWQGGAFDVAVRRVLRGVQALESPSLESVLVRQGRAAMVFVTLSAMVAWLPVVVNREAASGPRAAAALVSHWAMTGEVPPDVDLSRLVGAFDER